jgi:hypothetical protein
MENENNNYGAALPTWGLKCVVKEKVSRALFIDHARNRLPDLGGIRPEGPEKRWR